MLTCNLHYVALQLNYFYTSKHVACRHKLSCMYGADFLFRYWIQFSLKVKLITPVVWVLCATHSNSEKLLLPSHSIVWLQWHPFPSFAEKPREVAIGVIVHICLCGCMLLKNFSWMKIHSWMFQIVSFQWQIKTILSKSE